MKANTPLELLFQNTKDIALLKQQIAPVYACTIDLGTESASVAVADTNLTTDLKKAFIVDTKGDLYKLIAFNDDKTTAYIEYYTNVKGPKGDTGATGETGANGADGQDGADGYSICYSSDDFDEGTTTYTKANLSANVATLRANDVVLFKNGYLVVIYSVSTTTYETANGTAVLLDLATPAEIPTITIEASQIIDQYNFNLTQEQSELLATHPSFINLIINGVNYPLNLAYSTGNNQHYVNIAYIDTPASIMILEYNFDILYNNCVVTQDNFAKSKQLYLHNINCSANPWFNIQIINDNDTPFTWPSILQYLNDNGFKHAGNATLSSVDKYYKCSGTDNIVAIYVNTISTNGVLIKTGSYLEITYTPTINDIVVAL